MKKDAEQVMEWLTNTEQYYSTPSELMRSRDYREGYRNLVTLSDLKRTAAKRIEAGEDRTEVLAGLSRRAWELLVEPELYRNTDGMSDMARSFLPWFDADLDDALREEIGEDL